MEQRKPRAIKKDIMNRVLKLYVAAILMGVVVAIRLVYIQFFSAEVSVNADKLDKVIYSRSVLRAHRGAIRARTGEPLSTSIFRSTIFFDFGAEGFDDESSFKRDADSLSKLLSAHFGDKSAKDYYNRMVSERRSHNKIEVKPVEVVTKGWFNRVWKTMRGQKLDSIRYDTIHRRTHHGANIFRPVDYNEWQMMRTWPILGSRSLTYTREQHSYRIYPCGAIARSIIGRMDDKGLAGLNGLERVFNNELAGKNGIEWRQRIAYGFSTRVDKPAYARHDSTKIQNPASYYPDTIRICDIDNRAPEDGLDVITTIDIDIQEVADRILRNQVANQHSIWGTTMVMDVETGDLLAVANISRDKNGQLVENFNHAFRSRTEPGSTFKLASMLALLDEAKVSVTKTYNAGNGHKVAINTGKNNIYVTDSGDDGGIIDMHTALAKSSNTYFAQAVYEAYRDDPERYINFLRHLHFDRKVCVGIPESFGEIEPNFLHPGKSNWTKHESLIKIAFGQGGMEVTPLQVLTLYNAVANNGRMVAPRLVLELRDGDKTVKKFPVEVLENNICSSSTLKEVRSALEEAALTGTGKELFGEGKLPFRAALKTGTAEYTGKGIRYTDGYFVASMATYFPADKPRYTIMTSIHTHRSYGLRSGAKLAGPVNSEIAKFIYARYFDNGSVTDHAEERHYATSIKGGSISQIREVSDKFAHKTKYDDRRGWGRVEVDEESRTAVIETIQDTDLTVMPDVTGMGLKDALFLLEERGLKVSFTGRGAVRSQSIRPGTTVQRGWNVTLVLK